MIAPKPKPRADKVPFWRHLLAFRADILSAQPAKLYRAWMAEMRTPFFRSFLCNDPTLIDEVLCRRPADFPKSDRVRAGLAPLLGRSVFVTNGAEWARQRRIIDPAFGAGGLQGALGAMVAAGQGACASLAERLDAPLDIEEATSHLAADVIFRTLFSVPIGDETAARVFHAFRAHQRGQPLLNLGAFFRLPAWMPRFHRGATRRTARTIRTLIKAMVDRRAAEIAAGTAPHDLATKIMTTTDPVTGRGFTPAEMVDQIAIFFLAGHETSASALAWALYLLAADPVAQDRAAGEAARLPEDPTISDISGLAFVRDVFRETLRLYPPVPMMVRESRCPVRFRGREVRRGDQVVLSPWHLHRHERLWDRPDDFDPGRWQTEAARQSARAAYLPFSAGPRVCIGAGFAMIEGPLLLAMLLRRFRFVPADPLPPVPVAFLTVRARDGIRLRLAPRAQHSPLSGPATDDMTRAVGD